MIFGVFGVNELVLSLCIYFINVKVFWNWFCYRKLVICRNNRKLKVFCEFNLRIDSWKWIIDENNWNDKIW